MKRNKFYLELRTEAAKQKEAYINGNFIEKRVFLNGFSKAEEILEEDYVGYEGEAVEFDICELERKRKANATYLIDGLKDLSEIKLWRDVVYLTRTTRNYCQNALVIWNDPVPLHNLAPSLIRFVHPDEIDHILEEPYLVGR